MFNLFGKKDGNKKTKITDIIWASEEAKRKGLLDLYRKDPSIAILCWFEATQQDLQSVFSGETPQEVVYTIGHTHSTQVKGKNLVFAEHYPLRKKEEELFAQWQLEKATIHAALNEPLFLHFGGEKILQLMRQLGMREDESIQNDLISKAISRAQEKIEDKVSTELLCASQKDWLDKNLVPTG